MWIQQRVKRRRKRKKIKKRIVDRLKNVSITAKQIKNLTKSFYEEKGKRKSRRRNDNPLNYLLLVVISLGRLEKRCVFFHYNNNVFSGLIV